MDVNLPQRIIMLLNQARARVMFLPPPYEHDKLQGVIEVLEEAVGHLRQAQGEPLRESKPSATTSAAGNPKRQVRTQ